MGVSVVIARAPIPTRAPVKGAPAVPEIMMTDQYRVRIADGAVIEPTAHDDPVRPLPAEIRRNEGGELQDLLISWGQTGLLARWVGHAALDVVDQAPALEPWQQAGDPAAGALEADLEAGLVTRTAPAVDRPVATVAAARRAAARAAYTAWRAMPLTVTLGAGSGQVPIAAAPDLLDIQRRGCAATTHALRSAAWSTTWRGQAVDRDEVLAACEACHVALVAADEHLSGLLAAVDAAEADGQATAQSVHEAVDPEAGWPSHDLT